MKAALGAQSITSRALLALLFKGVGIIIQPWPTDTTGYSEFVRY